MATPNCRPLGNPSEGLARWKKLPESERKQLDDVGAYDPTLCPTPPAGGLIVKVFARGLTRDGLGHLSVFRDQRSHLSKEPGRDFLWLTEAEWRSLVPAKPRQGQSSRVPPGIVDRMCRVYLTDLVRVGGNGGANARENTLGQELDLTVEQVSPQRLLLRLTGSARFRVYGENNGVTSKEGKVITFHLLGFLDYQRQKKAFDRFDVVALSETGHFDEGTRTTMPLGIAFELTLGERPADRIWPYSFSRDYYGKHE